MINFDFANPTRIIFGSGKLEELGNQHLPGKKAMLLISNGKSTKINGAYERTIKQLEKANIELKIQILCFARIFKAFRLSNVQTLCIFPCFCPYQPKQGKFFYASPTTLSKSLAEVLFASLVEWA